MKVLEVFGEPIASGGQESFVFNVLKTIDRTDLQIDFFTPYCCSNPYYEALIREYDGKLICGNLPFEAGQKRSAIIRPLQDCLSDGNYDAVHIHSIRMSILAYAAYAAHHCGVPNIIVHSHYTVKEGSLKYALQKAYCGFFFHQYPSQFCACSQEAGACRYPQDITKHKLQVIPNGIDLPKFVFSRKVREEIRERLDIDDSTLLVGHVGRFSKEKNHDFDLEVLSLLREKTDAVKLLLIGEGEREAVLREQTAAKGLEKNVIFQGVVTNVHDYLQAMDVFILPSLLEGLPIVGIEAQASGLPVLTSEQVTREMKQTDSVFYLPLNKPERWAEKILSLRNQRFLDNDRVLESKGYSIQNTAALVRKLYFPAVEQSE
jgi:glycosyltransferase involved in cell wall biosynthesis